MNRYIEVKAPEFLLVFDFLPAKHQRMLCAFQLHRTMMARLARAAFTRCFLKICLFFLHVLKSRARIYSYRCDRARGPIALI